MRTPAISRWLGTLLAAIALPAGAQSIPAFNVGDMWWNSAESGWAVSLVHSAGSNQLCAIWHTYDPREPEPFTAASDFKPIWIVMTGGTWTTPTTFTGDAYVMNGTPFSQPWVAGALKSTRVGRFTLSFSSATRGTFTYELSAPTGLAVSDPAFGFPTLTGSKSIQRFDF